MSHSRSRLAPGIAARNKILYNCKRNARRRGLVWGLSDERAAELMQQPCHYCGDAPAMVGRPSQSNTGNYIYNGIDRKDNGQGYVEDNVVPCCKTCNWAKGKMDYDEFLDWLHRVAAFYEE